MKNVGKKMLLFVACTHAGAVFAESVTPSYIAFRSPSRDVAAKLVGTTNQIHLADMDEACYGTFFIRPAYKQTFRNDRITDCLFGNAVVESSGNGNGNGSGCRSLRVSGTDPSVTRNDSKDLMAENFYLPRDFTSTLNFDPRARTFVLDFNLWISLNSWCEGMYMRLYGPYVHSRYDLRFNESNVKVGTLGYEPGFFSSAGDATTPVGVPVNSLLQSFTAYGRGDAPSNIPVGNNNTKAITAQGLKNAKIVCDKQTDNCFGDLRFELGYDFCLDECYHFGINLQVAAPTGPRPKGEFLFEAQCGNGKMWELGAGINGHYQLWCCEDDEDRHLDFWIEADITHMFEARQTRVFDLKGKPLSRYMLAEQMDAASVTTTTAGAGGVPATLQGMTGPTDATAAFNGTYAPVANFTAREVKVSAAVQADIVAMFTYTCDCFGWDVGYNFWTRSCEKIKADSKDCPVAFPENTWALKGDAAVYGFASTTNIAGMTLGDAFALSATQSGSNIHAGLNKSGAMQEDRLANPTIDNRQLALVSDKAATPATDTLVSRDNTGAPATNQVGTSIQPVFIKESDLDLCGAETKGLSHKIFTHFNYTWLDCDDWIPYIGLGVEAEFGKNEKRSKTTSTSTSSSNCSDSSGCTDCALSQWGVWLKAGLSFN